MGLLQSQAKNYETTNAPVICSFRKYRDGEWGGAGAILFSNAKPDKRLALRGQFMVKSLLNALTQGD